MSDKDVTTPRLVYRGAANDTAETKEVADQGALDQALNAGWRLTRVDQKHPAKAAPAATITVPAQTLQTDGAAADTPAEVKQAAADKQLADKAAADAAKAAAKADKPAKRK